jgi:hypothetical protein
MLRDALLGVAPRDHSDRALHLRTAIREFRSTSHLVWRGHHWISGADCAEDPSELTLRIRPRFVRRYFRL